MRKQNKIKTILWAGMFTLAGLAASPAALAHCDSLDGPVITEARSALEKKDVTALLKWVPAGREGDVRAAFSRAQQNRGGDKATREAADQQLFATLVRIHRESEGAPFTGVQPAGHIPAIVTMADSALKTDNVEAVVARVTAHVEQEIRARFASAQRSKQHAGDSVTRGREYVNDYIHYVHFVEEASNLGEAAAPGHHD
ncbi:DUF6448 family protein [Shimwellia blattae]|uniref:Secreted protein n=1 Tax=Shimwellia blattae (strain ATCC 29907 / DSM 4481 / JCM 1650 / NBRC 105725 / CDC 9005-74) TaxID=630626 RepID=I2B4T5_SHIBC|nr:DUF6448 family protein [Shimwellia blattae]AFJ45539.1 hypothetical protein EBL_c04120 [Shimwellia blattae DSM 4481 = NBRC 105725]GAB81521.1 hypothetical protein EB105725_14_00880 [Shimwellia blattae DSM 4481 = NBRC 105725]VDY63022.1 Uncharacterised protein [Shimwellia blattae]VEC20144.1 Uncharacterised protein [Shimwellia blattae]